MRRALWSASLIALLSLPAWAQTVAVEPLQGQQAIAPQATTMYAAKSANIRAGAGKSYGVIGKTRINDALQIVGLIPGGWYQLATGGYVAASTVSPTPVAPHHHKAVLDVPPPVGNYPVGACEPYSRVVNIGGQPNQIDGTACKQPDGSWRIVNYGVPTPVVAPTPVYVAPAPLVYAPPVIIEHDHGPRHFDRGYDRDRDREGYGR